MPPTYRIRKPGEYIGQRPMQEGPTKQNLERLRRQQGTTPQMSTTQPYTDAVLDYGKSLVNPLYAAQQLGTGLGKIAGQDPQVMSALGAAAGAIPESISGPIKEAAAFYGGGGGGPSYSLPSAPAAQGQAPAAPAQPQAPQAAIPGAPGMRTIALPGGGTATVPETSSVGQRGSIVSGLEAAPTVRDRGLIGTLASGDQLASLFPKTYGAENQARYKAGLQEMSSDFRGPRLSKAKQAEQARVQQSVADKRAERMAIEQMRTQGQVDASQATGASRIQAAQIGAIGQILADPDTRPEEKQAALAQMKEFIEQNAEAGTVPVDQRVEDANQDGEISPDEVKFNRVSEVLGNKVLQRDLTAADIERLKVEQKRLREALFPTKPSVA
jgi:hypothetical protein